jgi:penicillin-binding protein 1C
MIRHGLFALVFLLGLSAGVRDAFDRWVDDTQLPQVLVETSVEMRDRQGKLLRVFPVENGRVRLAPDLATVDPTYLAMLIAYEDKRFYQHNGVDPIAALRALGQAVRSGRVVSGGSTLTMQVARLLENSGTGRWQGKLRQIRVALALERRLSKEKILELYLAHAPYGGPVEGIRAGSLAWFGKEPKRLTPAEAALLIALPQSPETRRPDRHLAVATAARARVLERVKAADQLQLSAVPQRMKAFPRLAPHLTDAIRQSEPAVSHHTLTLDAHVQTQVEDLLRRAVQGQPFGVSAAMVIADHRSGEIMASAGSAAYSADNGALGFVDMTRAIRSPGSTLKPFVYALAFDQGLAHPDTLINDAPVTFGRYAPQNFDGVFRGDLTVREALQLSLNIPPVLLTQEIGPTRLMAALREGGADVQVPGGRPGLAVALGGAGISLNDLVQLYAGLANGGVARPLIWQEVQSSAAGTPFLAASAAWQVSDILSDIPPPRGLGLRSGQIAYKTGTSYGHRDAWAVGFDGAHVIGVWMGRPDGTPVPGAFGGDLAAPLMFEAFGRLKPDLTPLPPPPPETVILSTASLPKPLQRFRSRNAVFVANPDAPEVLFPPRGAILRQTGEGIPLKIAKGQLPLTVLVNGSPVRTGVHQREITLTLDGPGFSQIAVVDAEGQSAQVEIRLD